MSSSSTWFSRLALSLTFVGAATVTGCTGGDALTEDELAEADAQQDEAATASSESELVTGCNTLIFPPHTNLVITSVRNMKCSTAKTVWRRFDNGEGAVPTRPWSIRPDWQCERVEAHLGGLLAQYRCARGARAFRVDFAD